MEMSRLARCYKSHCTKFPKYSGSLLRHQDPSNLNMLTKGILEASYHPKPAINYE